jgi:arginine exporter protein ArgO
MKNLFIKAKAAVIAFLAIPLVSRALHTFWQAVLSYLIVSALAPNATVDTKILLMGALGAGLSAVKTMAIAYVQGLKA